MAGRAKKLTPQQIIDVALAMIDEDGMEQLSMRRLGSALGVEAMSVYNHFRNKSDLLDAVQARLLEEMPPPPSWGPAGLWRAQAQRAAENFRTLLRQHPRALPLLASRAAVAERSLVYFEAGVNIFLQAGLSAAESLRAFHCIFSFVVGHAAFHFLASDQDPRETQLLYKDYPGLAQVAGLQAYDAEAEFDYGLELLLVGLEKHMAQPGPA